jgi:hypothetical protein
MEKITSVAQLKEAILELEIKQAREYYVLKEQFRMTYESMKPVNLIKNKFNEIVSSPNLKENLINATLSIAAGYLSKKATVGSTHNPIKQLLGTLIQMGVTGIVAKNADSIKSAASDLIGGFLNKKGTKS